MIYCHDIHAKASFLTPTHVFSCVLFCNREKAFKNFNLSLTEACFVKPHRGTESGQIVNEVGGNLCWKLMGMCSLTEIEPAPITMKIFRQ